MPRVVHVATDAVRIPVARDRVQRVADRVLRAERVRHALISITFVTDQKIAVPVTVTAVVFDAGTFCKVPMCSTSAARTGEFTSSDNAVMYNDSMSF